MPLNLLALSIFLFFDCPFFLLYGEPALDIFDHVSGHKRSIFDVAWIFVPAPCIPIGRFSFNIVNCLNPEQTSDSSRAPSTLQFSSIRS